jgi:Importin-beta N-terminal domain
MASDLLVFETLKYATSQDPTTVKQAEEHLKTLETENGFLKVLTQISLNVSVEPQIRLMALVKLKLCIEKYWRVTAKK